MKSRPIAVPTLAALVAAMAICNSQPAHATLSMSTLLQAIHQVGFTATVSLGHVVVASTNMNRLIAGGSFTTSCVSPQTGTIDGDRTLTSDLLLRTNALSVTIPAQLPALRDMPGFENVAGGTSLACTYRWRSNAKEATYSVNVLGVGFTMGGEEKSDGDTVRFEMYQPGTDGEDNNNGCMHN